MPDPIPAPGVEIDSTTFVCGRCKKTFPHLKIEAITGGVRQLRIDNLMITRIEAACLHCGKIFLWNIREQDVEKLATAYGEVLRRVGYIPE